MNIAFFAYQDYEKDLYQDVNQEFSHNISFFKDVLTEKNMDSLKGHEAISIFVSNPLNKEFMSKLASKGAKLILLRSTGYNHVDVQAAKALGFSIMNVPGYSPESIAEHAVALLLALYRKLILVSNNVNQYNFSLDNIMGEAVYGKTIGIIGVGQIGTAFSKIMKGFSCKTLGYDPIVNNEISTIDQWVELPTLLAQSDIISLHCPLNEQTKHIINKNSLALMNDGTTLLNTGRGELINTKDLIAALDSGKIKYAGLDVYEYEQGLFFTDEIVIDKDPLLEKLLAMENLLITPHIGFYTKMAIRNIAFKVLNNAKNFELLSKDAPNII